MALRLLSRQLRPVQSFVRFASQGTPAPSAPAGPGVTGRIPDEAEQATGIEKKELNELLKGNDDPFGLSGMKYGAFGTKAAPREIPTHFDSRLVGCCCEEDSEHISWFEVKKGGPQQCPCPRRQWFKLVPAAGDVSH